MSQQRTLTVTSLLTLFLFTLHWADEISRGIEPGTMASVWGFGILFVWIYATLAIGEKRLGIFGQFLFSLLGGAVPILHMQHAGWVGGRIPPNSPGALLWVWTLIALGTCGMISAALAVRVLWNMSSISKAGKRGAGIDANRR
jgi:hypothetical protein